MRLYASDAFGPGSSPGGHTNNNVVFFRKIRYDVFYCSIFF